MRGCGAVDGDRANFLSCVALSAGEARFSGVAVIEAWLSARATVGGSVLSCGMANLDQVASVGSSLLRLYGGSVASFTWAVDPSVFASRVHLDVARHWFGAVKKFRLSGNSYTCCRRRRPWASRAGEICMLSLPTVITLVLLHMS